MERGIFLEKKINLIETQIEGGGGEREASAYLGMADGNKDLAQVLYIEMFWQ